MDNGVFEEAWRRGLHQLDRKGRVDWNVAMADATFVPAKKGAHALGRPNGALFFHTWAAS